MLAHLFLIESSSKFLITWTSIKALMRSIFGRIRPLILELLALVWRKFHTFGLEYLWSQFGQSWSNFMCSTIGVGERLHKVLGQIGSKLWFPRKQKVPTELKWGKWCLQLFSVVFDRSFLYLQATRTCIKSQTSLNFGQIGPLTTELAALEHLKNFP